MANVYDFGAAGDGETDETDALQHALDAGDGILRLNKGTYRISRPLVLDLTRQGFSAVRGESGTSRIIMTGPGPAMRIIGDHQGTAQPATVRPATWDRERFPQVSGLEIVGEHPEAVGIELRKTMKCVVSQVLVRRCRYGLHLVERNRDFLLADSHFYDNHEIGVFLDCCNLHQINIHGCHISWNRVAGIMSLAGDIHNLQIVGNDIEYNNVTSSLPGKPAEGDSALSGHDGGCEIFFDAREGIVSEVTISGNTIQSTVQKGGANLRIWGAEIEAQPRADTPASAKPDTVHVINVTGNVLGSQWRGVELRNMSRATITGNTIYDSADLSIVGYRCSGIVVSGNSFSWRGIDSEPVKDGIRFEDSDNVLISSLVTQRLCAGSAEQGAAITLVRCRDCGISDCQVLDPLHRGIELADCQRCRVANNTIVDRRVQRTMRNAIRITGQGRDNLIAGNILGSAVDKLIDVDDPSTAMENNIHALDVAR